MVQLLLLWLRHFSGEGTLFIFVLVSLQDVVPLLIWCETNSRFYSKCPVCCSGPKSARWGRVEILHSHCLI